MSAPIRLAPLLARPDGRVAERLRPYRELGILDSLDVHVADHLGMLVGEDDPDVLLALALAVRAPRHGHVCVDLAELEDEGLFGEPDDGSQVEPARPPPLPTDRGAWLARIGRSPLVRTPDGLEAARPFVLDGSALYTDRYFTYEERLAQALRARLEVSMKPVDSALLGHGLRALAGPMSEPFGKPFEGLERQRLAAATALLRGFCVISGGPGTGKTYTVRIVLALLWAQWARSNDPGGDAPGPRVALAAPTGKAAFRMKEAMQHGIDEFLGAAASVLGPHRTPDQLRSFLDGLEPSTIHRLLGFDPLHPSRFRHKKDDPVPYDVVVIDETSMVDLALMCKLVDAVSDDARIILLGDQHQLSSVEAGTVLADLCGSTSVDKPQISRAYAEELARMADVSGLDEHARVREDRGPYDAIVALDRSRRFRPDSGIALFAKECLSEKLGEERVAALLRTHDDVELLGHGERGAPCDAARDAILAGYAPYLRRLHDGPKQGETLDDLHRHVLELFDGFRILCAHRRGPTGVATMNDFVVRLLSRQGLIQPTGEFWVGRPILVTRNDYVVGLYNGDVGIVVSDAQGDKTVVFPVPSTVRAVAPARLPDHETVFAMTIHKSQGSEFAHAMVVLPERPSPILTRELIYTGVTRAMAKMTMLGSSELLVQGLARSVRRASGLRAQVWGAKAGAGA